MPRTLAFFRFMRSPETPGILTFFNFEAIAGAARGLTFLDLFPLGCLRFSEVSLGGACPFPPAGAGPPRTPGSKRGDNVSGSIRPSVAPGSNRSAFCRQGRASSEDGGKARGSIRCLASERMNERFIFGPE